ncbi:MAG TPA: hypothetical protein VIE43_26080 [Thermoanaerobaculia bacterium]|nr:hypothetical protein [Thermoanaerobaculia bacterium]
MIRRTVALTTLTAAILVAVPAPSHAAQSRRAMPDVQVSATDLMTQALSWLQGFLGVSAPVSHRTVTVLKDTTTTPPPTIPFPPPPNTGGSGNMTDPDGKAK